MPGAVEDLRYMQRDFAVYFVNVFDTMRGARLLDREAKLVSLVAHYCRSVWLRSPRRATPLAVHPRGMTV